MAIGWMTLAWLLVAAWQDVRARAVSAWLTNAPLAGAVLWRGVQALVGEPSLADGLAPALLLALVIGLDSLPAPVVPAAFAACAAAVAAWHGSLLTPVVWAVAYALWRLNVVGGADIKLALALLTFFPDPRLAAWLAACAGAVSLVALLTRGQVYDKLLVTGLRVRYLDFPSRGALEAQGFPLVVSFPLAFAAWWASGGIV